MSLLSADNSIPEEDFEDGEIIIEDKLVTSSGPDLEKEELRTRDSEEDGEEQQDMFDVHQVPQLTVTRLTRPSLAPSLTPSSYHTAHSSFRRLSVQLSEPAFDNTVDEMML